MLLNSCMIRDGLSMNIVFLESLRDKCFSPHSGCKPLPWFSNVQLKVNFKDILVPVAERRSNWTNPLIIYLVMLEARSIELIWVVIRWPYHAIATRNSKYRRNEAAITERLVFLVANAGGLMLCLYWGLWSQARSINNALSQWTWRFSWLDVYRSWNWLMTDEGHYQNSWPRKSMILITTATRGILYFQNSFVQ